MQKNENRSSVKSLTVLQNQVNPVLPFGERKENFTRGGKQFNLGGSKGINKNLATHTGFKSVRTLPTENSGLQNLTAT